MTVGELIALLQTHDPDDLVILAKDEESNSYSPIEECDDGIYIPETTWKGDVYSREEASDWPEGSPCITLWPAN